MADPQPAASAEEPGFLIEQDKRFSESIIWRLQRQFYDARGPAAWSTGTVPSYVTSNPFIAQAYAHVVHAYLKDGLAAGAVDPTQPVYFIELGAGSGRFAYLFLKRFLALKSASSLRALDCRYVMTDFTPHNLKTWGAHPLFKPLFAAGQLDMGLFDVDQDTEIKLASGGVLSAGSIKNPVVALANYAFDTFVLDLFRIQNGVLHETRASIRAPKPEVTEPEEMAQFKIRYTHRPVEPDYYKDAVMNRILLGYRARLAETTIAMPVGAFSAIRRLLDLSGRRLLLLSSDKGFTHEDELSFLESQHMQFHGGALSMMVNYHAIAEYFASQGGVCASTTERGINLRTAMFLLGGEAASYADTLTAFDEKVVRFSPNDFWILVNNTRRDSAVLSMDHFLCLLKLSHSDPNIVLAFGKDVLNQLANAPELARLELHLALERVWDNYFPMGEDLPFLLGRFCLALKRPLEGIRYNQLSLDLFGETAGTYVNMGICHYYAENLQAALGCFERSLALAPAFEVSKAWRTKVLLELERRGRLPTVPPPS